ncbi:hydrogen peroxide-dependent heme synthase [Microbacterium marinilacus]|uniref:Coproheme decarboxylase n=1 Tax=Microbacterium marinilacus TaxID=415209 RepID=A0ABP7BUC5_9MICO|nr:hydrogen peroxide-dependent heme synthase [Microbacterium marinilacus]MBY0688201.1 chlorite dismutase family protein [Microbacterium marinilacus]
MAELHPGSPAADEPEIVGDNYSLFAVWRRDPAHPLGDADEIELENIVSFLSDGDVTVRGFYDVSGLRADADLMVWVHGPVAQDLQRAVRRLRRTELLRTLLPTWNAMSVHRDAEFNKRHVPGYLRGIAAKQWLTVYPFVRSYEWYLLPEEERRHMLVDHGKKGAAFRGVTANTMASFALGDYEWMLPMEADELTDLVDMMRELRYTEARRHVREEVPFFTGRRIEISEIAEILQ